MLLVATLACAILAGCTGGSTPGPNRTAPPSPSLPPASSAHVSGSAGSAGNPLVVSCDAESWPVPPAPFHPQPGDLVIGPLDIASIRALATMTPAEHGYSSDGHGGRFYKFGMIVRPGATVTVTIGAAIRGHVLIAAPGVGNLGLAGVASATYHACRQAGGFFAQGFAFTHRPYRGCVPLDVTIGNRPPVRHVTLSLFAGPCTTDPVAGTTAN